MLNQHRALHSNEPVPIYLRAVLAAPGQQIQLPRANKQQSPLKQTLHVHQKRNVNTDYAKWDPYAHTVTAAIANTTNQQTVLHALTHAPST